MSMLLQITLQSFQQQQIVSDSNIICILSDQETFCRTYQTCGRWSVDSNPSYCAAVNKPASDFSSTKSICPTKIFFQNILFFILLTGHLFFANKNFIQAEILAY